MKRRSNQTDSVVTTFALIGAGRRSWAHLAIAKKMKNLRCIAVYDVVEERAVATANKFEIPKIAASVDQIFEGECNAVMLASSSASHFKLARKALIAEKHVLCEKPVALRASEVAELKSIAESNRLVFHVAHQMRFEPYILKFKELLEKKTIGEVRSASIRLAHNWGGNTEDIWIDKEIDSPGGVLFDLGIHIFDLIGWFWGPISGIDCVVPTSKFRDEEVGVNCIVRTENGVTVFISLGWDSPVGRETSITCDGTLARVKFQNSHDQILLEVSRTINTGRWQRLVRECHYPSKGIDREADDLGHPLQGAHEALEGLWNSFISSIRGAHNACLISPTGLVETTSWIEKSYSRLAL